MRNPQGALITAGGALIALVAFVAASGFDDLELRNLAFVAYGLVAVTLVMIPSVWSLRLLMLYVGFEGFAKIVTFYHPVVHVGTDLLLVTLCTKSLVILLRNRSRIPARLPPLMPLFAIHVGWFFIAFANPYALSLYASAAGAKMYLSVVTLYFFGYFLTRSLRDVHWVMAIWVVVAATHAITGLMQGFEGPSSVLSIHSGYAIPLKKFEGTAFRPFGLTHLPGGPSVYIFLAMPFIFYFLMQSRSILARIGVGAIIPVATATLFLCQVRSALLKSIVGAVAFMLQRFALASEKPVAARLRNAAVAAVAMAATVLIASPLLQSSVEENLDNAKAIDRSLSLFEYEAISKARGGAWERFVDYSSTVPFGAGLSRTGAAAGKFYEQILTDTSFDRPFFTDNFWLATLVDLGLPGMLILTLIVGAILFRGAIQSSRLVDPDLRAANAALFSALLAMVVGMYGAEAILYNPESVFFWYFAGTMLKLDLLDKGVPSA